MSFERVIIVGDIHGCRDEMRDLLDNVVKVSHRDLLVLLGDLLDKGPHGPECVRDIRERAEDGQPVEYVLANHEEKNLRYIAAAGSGKALPEDPQGELAENAQRLLPADVDFLREHAKLYVRIPGHDALAVHAGVPPKMQELPPLDLSGLSSADRDKAHQLLRIRQVRAKDEHVLTVCEINEKGNATSRSKVVFDGKPIELDGRVAITRIKVRKAGEMLALDAAKKSDPFWADMYDGHFGHIYFGHTPFRKKRSPKVFPHATGMDLGCVFGGRLAAAILRPAGQVSFASVAAKQTYSNNFRE